MDTSISNKLFGRVKRVIIILELVRRTLLWGDDSAILRLPSEIFQTT